MASNNINLLFFIFYFPSVQIENAEQDATKLPLVPSLLGDLISLAQAEIEDLCTSHEFVCTQNTLSFSLSRCGASVHLYPARAEIHSSTHTASLFAASAMRQFEYKVTGTGTAVKKRRNEEENVGGKKENDADDDDEFLLSNISEYIDILIEEARSVDNLARMFEGWMPWV